MMIIADARSQDRKPIGRMLIDEGLIEPDHLKQALELQQSQGGKTVELLIRLGHIDIGTVAQFLATRPGIASIALENYVIPQELCELVPREFAVENEVFPLDRLGNSLTVAMAFPIDLPTIEALEEMTEMRVSAFLCCASDIRQAIHQYYPRDGAAEAPIEMQARIETGLRLGSITHLVRRIDSLPTLPQTVQRVQEVMSDPDSSLKDIAEIVSSDPPIAAKLLQLANSAAYGFLSRINNVQGAITLLGMRETYMAVLSSAVLNVSEQASYFDHEGYWRASQFRAGAARKIAAVCGEGRNPAVFTTSLLSDIGQFALAEVARDQYKGIPAHVTGADLIAVEEEALGIGHAEAGHILAIHWKLPEDIAEAIRFHHKPESARDYPKLAAVTALAAIIADRHLANEPPEESLFDSHMELLGMLEIDASRATDIYSAMRSPEMMELSESR